MVFFLPCLAEGQNCSIYDWRGFQSNPDSIRVDTCNGHEQNPQFSVKRGYRITFDDYAIKLGYAEQDSVVEVEWSAIDTSFVDLREAFHKMADSIGGYKLRKLYPSDTGAAGLLPRLFAIDFDQYVLTDSLDSCLSRINGINFHWRPIRPSTVIPNDLGMQVGSQIGQIKPGAGNSTSPNYHSLGWQWNLWKVKCPMAWEITRGEDDVHLLADDIFNDIDEFNPAFSSPDLSTRTTSNEEGNFLVLDRAHRGSTDPQNPGDGRPTRSLTLEHGAIVSATMVAKADNDDNSNYASMAGVANKAVALGIDETKAVVSEIDLDRLMNNVLTPPEVANESFGSTDHIGAEGGDNLNAVKKGIVVVASAGNGLVLDYVNNKTGVDCVLRPSPVSHWRTVTENGHNIIEFLRSHCIT